MSATILTCVKRLNDEATIAQASDGTADVKERQYYLVTVQEETATPLEVAWAGYTPSGGNTGNVALPAYLGAHPYDSDLTVLTKNVKRAPSSSSLPARKAWLIECDFGYAPSNGKTPTANDIKVSVNGQRTSAYTQLSQGSNPKPILNSAKDTYPDPIEIALYDEVISVSYTTSFINGNDVAALRGKINSGVVNMTIPQGLLLTYSRSFPKHTLLVDSCDYSVTLVAGTGSGTGGNGIQVGSSQAVWSVQLVLVYRPDGWDATLPQKGYRYLVDNPDAGEDEDQTKYTEWKEHAVYLDADGYKLADGAALVTVDPKPQIYKEGDIVSLIDNISSSPLAIERHAKRLAAWRKEGKLSEPTKQLQPGESHGN